VSGAQSITADATNIEELTALVIQSGGSLAMTQAQADAFAGKLTKESGAGNVTATVTGDVSALNLSVVDAITLGGNTILVDSTADLKAAAAINATTKLITVNNTIDLTAKTITNYGSLTVDTNQVTVSAEQIHGFAAGSNTVTKTNGGLVTVHVGSTADISSLDTSDATSIVLNTTNSNVTMTAAQNLQVASGAGTNTITLSGAGTTNGVAGIENYVLSSAGVNSFTMASNTAQVTGGTNNDTIVGGTGASTIIGGQGVDILRGDNGADIFSFSTGHTGITALTADRILDFATGVDQIKINGTKGDVVEADGASMLFSNFTAAATAAFNGGIDVYAAYNVSGSGDTYVAIDHNASGSFNSGDSLIVLNNLNLDNQLVAGDFIA
jgi:Ca2+-binding RTX toxin-like protein